MDVTKLDGHMNEFNAIYYTNEFFNLAKIGKVGSSSFLELIGRSLNKFENRNRFLVPHTNRFYKATNTSRKINGEVLVAVRDPIERFKSACLQLNIHGEDVDFIIKQLDNKTVAIFNYHFAPQFWWAKGHRCKLFKFPEHLGHLVAKMGFVNMPKINVSEDKKGEKPNLSDSQISNLLQIYKEDIELFDSIKNPGEIREF
jgi:hypothetical protein